MILTPMRYKGYTWPHNPRVYSIDYERKMATNKVPFGLYYLQDLGRTRRVMEGEGEFVGEGAYSQFGELANVFHENGPGLLIHPVWQAASAYFVTLRLEQEPLPNYVRYSFSFWEDVDYYSGAASVQTAGSISGTGTGSGTSPAAGASTRYRVVQGDTLWGIAQRFGLPLETLVALNPQIKNPNLIRPGDEVRVA
mgnify:CR=1 FL=1